MVNRNEPCDHTCPLINSLQKELKEAEGKAKHIRYHSEDPELQDMASDIESTLSNVHYELENLRSSNDKLRTWGNDLVEKLEEVERDLKSTIKQLEKYE